MTVQEKEILKDKKCFILDMDGTFYLGDTLLDGSLEFMDRLKSAGKDFLFFTNNSSKNPDVYVQKLSNMGFPIDKDKIVTSGMVTIHYIKKHYLDSKVLLLGTPMLEDQFIDMGISLVDEDPDLVVVGFDTTITYDKLTRACTYVRQGVPFLATHPDFNCPMEDGPIPDCGAICAFITASAEVLPKYLGKPHTETLDFILDHLGYSGGEIVFVGDRLYTDIAIGVNHGVTSILVLSGETQKEDIDASDVKPDLVVDRLVDIVKFI